MSGLIVGLRAIRTSIQFQISSTALSYSQIRAIRLHVTAVSRQRSRADVGYGVPRFAGLYDLGVSVPAERLFSVPMFDL